MKDLKELKEKQIGEATSKDQICIEKQDPLAVVGALQGVYLGGGSCYWI